MLVAGGGVALLAAVEGGYFATSWLPAGLGFAAAGALLVLSRHDARPIALLAILFLAGLGAIACWTTASAAWSIVPDASLREGARSTLYLVAALACVLAARGLLHGVVAAATLVGAFSLVDRLIVGPGHDAYESSLLAKPLGYANGLGLLVAMAAAACVVRALDAERLRSVTLLPLVVLIPVLALTGSRVAWIAGCAGTAIGSLLVYGKRRIAAICTVVCIAGLGVGLAISLPGQGERHAYWRVGRALAVERPVAGFGAGTYGSLYASSSAASRPAQDAHSLYLETLDELGITGLALLAGTLSLPLVGAFRMGAGVALLAREGKGGVAHAVPGITVLVPSLARELSGTDLEGVSP